MKLPINLPERVIKDQPVTADWANSIREAIWRLAKRKSEPSGGGGGGGSGPCPFGDVIPIPDTDPAENGVSGGLVFCGDQNYDVAPYHIPAEGFGKVRLWLELTDIELVTDDDVEVILSGVVTSTSAPTWQSATWAEETTYPTNTNPSTPTATGTIIIPIGVLTYQSGGGSFVAVACGPRWVSACDGILSVYNGEPPEA